jgi:hypothetical protein
MRRARFIAAAVIMVTALAAGCGGAAAVSAPPAAHPPAAHPPSAVTAGAVTAAEARQADIYEQVLRRYLGTPAENSFPGWTFKIVYVLNQAYADAADPNGKQQPAQPLAPQTQRQVTAALAGMTHVIFIADRASVIEAGHGCWHVKNGAILIVLGPPAGNAGSVRVGINGMVACLGATWLTYVLREQPGGGWRVTGTTGSMAVS